MNVKLSVAFGREKAVMMAGTKQTIPETKLRLLENFSLKLNPDIYLFVRYW